MAMRYAPSRWVAVAVGILSALASAFPVAVRSDCDPLFTQVSEDGFGNSDNRYAWSMIVFGDHLYVGTQNRATGAEIWRYDGAVWEPVVTNGLTSALNAGVRNLEVCRGAIYGGTDNLDEGAELWRSFDGVTWEPFFVNGNGQPQLRSVRGLKCVNFGGNDLLYIGLQNTQGAGRVLRTNGVVLQPVIVDGFGDPDNKSIHAFEMFNGAVYAGTQNSTDGLQIYRSFDGLNFEVVVGPGAATPSGFGHENSGATMDLQVFKNRLYVGLINFGGGFGVYRSADGVTYTKIGADGFGIIGNDYSWRYAVYEDHLWLGVLNTLAFRQNVLGGSVWRSPNGFAWEEMVGSPNATYLPWGFGDQQNYGIRTLEEFQGALYLGTAQNPSPPAVRTGLEIWKWPGEACPADGL